MQNIEDRATAYGVNYTGTLVGPEYHAQVEGDTYNRPWTGREVQDAGGRITRLRLLSDPGFPWWDVSYCHATLPNGDIVNVDLRGEQFPKRGLTRALVQYAIENGFNAKRIGLLDSGNGATLN